MKPLVQVLFVALSLAAPLAAAPQGSSPEKVTVTARFEPATAAPGAVVKLVLDAKIKPGFHIYGALEDSGQKPTLQVTGGSASLRLQGEFDLPLGDPHSPKDLPEMTNYWVVGEGRFEQEFRVAADARPGEHQVSAQFVYVVCDEQSCDPEARATVSAKLQVVQGGSATQPKTGESPAQVPATVPDEVPGGMSGGLPFQDPGGPQAGGPVGPEHRGKHQVMRMVVIPASARPGEIVTVEIQTEMEEGWHNYGSAQDPSLGQPTTMEVKPGKGFEVLGPADVPLGGAHELAGETYYFLEGRWKMTQQLRLGADAKPGDLSLQVDIGYMACDDGSCDDPVAVTLGAPVKVEAGAVRDEFAKQAATPAQGGREDLNQISLFLYLLGAVGAGLFALVMPCTYPMIPLTISFFTKQAEKKGGQPVFLALAYGGGIVFCFIVLGGLLGSTMTDLATDPWMNLLFGLAFVFFSLSLFGIIELRPPSFLMNSASKAQMMAAGSKSGIGTIFPVFLMGVTLCITSFACTAPFLGSMIAAGVNSGGGMGRLLLGMAVFGLTMALPFVALSLLPGKLPTGGNWMVTAKVLFGFIELAAALKFFSNTDLAWNWEVLPREVFLVIWAGLFAVAGVYLLGVVRLHGESGDIGGGRLLVATAVLCLAGYFALGATGYRLDNAIMQAFEPPYSAAGGGGGHSASVSEHRIVIDDFDKAVQLAKNEEKLLLVNFTGLL